MLTVSDGLQGKCSKEEKTVILQVYKERPRSLKRTERSLNHQIIGKNQLQQQGSNVWYDRRAEILHYSRQLRESARLGQGTPSTPQKPVPSDNHQPPTKVTVKDPSFSILRPYPRHRVERFMVNNSRCSGMAGCVHSEEPELQGSDLSWELQDVDYQVLGISDEFQHRQGEEEEEEKGC